jgi:hypothetical protein
MKVVDSVTVTLSLNAELPIKSSVDEQRDSVQLVDIASANEVVADEKVKTVDNQVETANKKVKTAEEMVATANKDVATAKEELAAAKRKVETAEDDKKEAAEKNLLKAEKNLAKVVWDLAEAKRVFAMAMRDLVALDPKAGGTTNWNYEVERTTSVAISLQTAYDNLVNPPATSTSSVVATIESAEAHRRAGVVPSHHMQDFMRAVADGKVEIISAQLPSIVPAGSDDPGKSKHTALYLHIKPAARTYDDQPLLFYYDSAYMFISPSYERVYQHLLSPGHVSQDNCLLGSSGTGKTCFIYYFVYRRIRENAPIIVDNFNSQISASTAPSSSAFEAVYLPKGFKEKSGQQVWSISDSISAQSVHPRATHLIFVSSDEAGASATVSSRNAVSMPPISLTALLDMSYCYPTVISVKNDSGDIDAVENVAIFHPKVIVMRYMLLGGEPRSVFRNLDDMPRVPLKSDDNPFVHSTSVHPENSGNLMYRIDCPYRDLTEPTSHFILCDFLLSFKLPQPSDIHPSQHKQTLHSSLESNTMQAQSPSSTLSPSPHSLPSTCPAPPPAPPLPSTRISDRGYLLMSHIPAWSEKVPSPTYHLHLDREYTETYQYIQVLFNQLLDENLSIDQIKTILSSPLNELVFFVNGVKPGQKNLECVGPVTFRYLKRATRHGGSDEAAVHNDELLFVSLTKNESACQTYVAVPRPNALYTFLQVHVKRVHDNLKSACLSLFQPSGYGFIFESCAVNALSNSTSLPITSPSQNSE